jgi:hypothetical protein
MSTIVVIAWPLSLILAYFVGSNNPWGSVKRKIIADAAAATAKANASNTSTSPTQNTKL